MSKGLKSPANTEAREKGIEERSYDLSVLTKEERINLLSLLYDDVRDVQDYLFLRVMDSPFDSCFTFDEFVYFTRLLKDHIDYCEHRLAENPFFPSYFVEYCSLSTSALDKLSSLIAPQSEQEQSDVTDTEPQEQEEEPQEQEREVKKTSANNTGAEEKGIEERTYYYADLRSELSDDELDFLVGFILCKFEDTHNEFYLKYIRDSEFSSSDIDQLLSLILDYLKVTPYKPGTISGNRYDMAKAIYHKLSEIVEEPQEQSYVTDTEPQEQEREEPNTEDFLINYLVTVYYVDGHSSFRSFSGCADGIVFNFQQNSLHLDDLENGNRSVFNMFNFPDSEEIVACDVYFTLIPDLPF